MNDAYDPGELPELTEAYRRTPAPEEAARSRLKARIRSQAPPRRGWVRIPAPGALSLRPAAAAALACLLLAAGYALSFLPWPAAGGRRAPAAAAGTRVAGELAPAGEEPSDSAPGRGEYVVEFVFVARGAASVSVVGDFNDWEAGRTPMRRADRAGTWITRVQLPEGRRVYAFVVDGDRWMVDPTTALAPVDELGVARSVIVVSGNGI